MSERETLGVVAVQTAGGGAMNNLLLGRILNSAAGPLRADYPAVAESIRPVRRSRRQVAGASPALRLPRCVHAREPDPGD